MSEITADPDEDWLDHALLEPLDADTVRTLQRILLRLAETQEGVAADEAAEVPYWKPCPHHVIGLRSAARTLRAAAKSIAMATRPINA